MALALYITRTNIVIRNIILSLFVSIYIMIFESWHSELVRRARLEEDQNGRTIFNIIIIWLNAKYKIHLKLIKSVITLCIVQHFDFKATNSYHLQVILFFYRYYTRIYNHLPSQWNFLLAHLKTLFKYPILWLTIVK